MSSKKKTTSTTNQTQTAAPPSWTQPGMEYLGGKVIDAYDQSQGNYYDGNFVAAPDQAMLDQLIATYSGVAQDAVAGGQTMQGIADQLLGGGNNPIFSQNFLPQMTGINDLAGYIPSLSAAPDPSQYAPTLANAPSWNAFTPDQWVGDDGGARLDAAMQAATDMVLRDLTQKVLPGIRSDSIAAGAYTGDRAMKVLPTEAIAQAGGRASEATAGLAYDGFQQEQARNLAAWQMVQQLIAQDSLASNEFNQQNWMSGNANQMDIFKTLTDAAMQGYGISEGNKIDLLQALTGLASSKNSSLVDLYRADTERGLGVSNSNLNNMGTGAQALLQALQLGASGGDIMAQNLQMQTAADQANIDNAVARNNYEVMYPFQGMDIATQLLSQLSGNYGTQTLNGTNTTVEKSSGLGNALQTVAGLGMAGAAMFGGGGPFAGLMGAGAGAATPAISSLFKPADFSRMSF